MKILIISIDHFVQCIKTGHENPLLKDRKDRLESLLRREIPARNVQFIAEEADSRYITIAQQLGNTYNPHILWKNIVMTEEEREEAGINDALKNRPSHAEKRGNEWVAIDHRIPEDDIREDFFVAETVRGAGKAESVMILCGDMHVDAVKKKLERYGHQVEMDESMVTDKEWV